MADAPQDQIAPLLNPEGWELLASLGPMIFDVLKVAWGKFEASGK